MYIIILLIIIILVWIIGGFIKYLNREKKNKIKIYDLLNKGLTLTMAFNKDLHDLNNEFKLGLSGDSVFKIARILSNLYKKMELDNNIGIYSMFVHRYILLKDRISKKPIKLDENKVLYAAENMKFIERNGYYALGEDNDEDDERKFPDNYFVI